MLTQVHAKPTLSQLCGAFATRDFAMAVFGSTIADLNCAFLGGFPNLKPHVALEKIHLSLIDPALVFSYILMLDYLMFTIWPKHNLKYPSSRNGHREATVGPRMRKYNAHIIYFAFTKETGRCWTLYRLSRDITSLSPIWFSSTLVRSSLQ